MSKRQELHKNLVATQKLNKLFRKLIRSGKIEVVNINSEKEFEKEIEDW